MTVPPGERHDDWAGVDYVVRAVAGARARKTYRCPGCDQELRPGTAHLVVWPAAGDPELDRRHWHRPCWEARARRHPRVERSRRAPRH